RAHPGARTRTRGRGPARARARARRPRLPSAPSRRGGARSRFRRARRRARLRARARARRGAPSRRAAPSPRRRRRTGGRGTSQGTRRASACAGHWLWYASVACLDDSVVAAFVERRLEAERLARAEEHLAACAACRQLIAALAEDAAPARERDAVTSDAT